jgi:hypothetical protein
MKCPSATCVHRAKDNGACIAPLDERVRRNCPLPPEAAKRLDNIKKRYPNTPMIWLYYLESLQRMDTIDNLIQEADNK